MDTQTIKVVGSIPSIRRNTIIAACLDVANLMERGGTGFQTMIECYQDCSEDIQPVVSIYPGFLNLRLFDKLYKEALINTETEELTDAERIIAILSTEGPKSVKELQEALNYNNRGHFLKNVLNPMLEEGVVYRDGKPKSPYAQIKINKIKVNSDFPLYEWKICKFCRVEKEIR